MVGVEPTRSSRSQEYVPCAFTFPPHHLILIMPTTQNGEGCHNLSTAYEANRKYSFS